MTDIAIPSEWEEPALSGGPDGGSGDEHLIGDIAEPTRLAAAAGAAARVAGVLAQSGADSARVSEAVAALNQLSKDPVSGGASAVAGLLHPSKSAWADLALAELADK
jgi:hypothetical protein